MRLRGVLIPSLGVMLLAFEAKAVNPPSFAEPEYLLPGHGLIAVEASDIDNDRDPDLVVLSSAAVISIFRNDGSGGFGPVETFDAPGSHLDFVVADLNGDESPDVAFADFSDGTVSVMLNDGTGLFGAAATFAAPGVSFCRGLAAGDLDGDGDRDLIVGDGFDTPKTVLLNNGSGGFDQNLPFNAGGTCIAITIDDLDGDGDRDAVTVFNGVWVHCNHGNGTFAPAVTLATGDGHTNVAIADLDADGDPDIAVSRSTSAGNNLARVFLNDGGPCGEFTLVDYPINTLSRDIALDDLNGDGWIDIATSHVSSINRVSLLTNLGDGRFGSPVEFFPGIYPQSLAIADLDADGRNDIATANQFHSPTTVGLLFNETSIPLPGDITGDGEVNIDDLLSVINAWGACPAVCPADVTGDGTVNIDDLLLVISNWS